MEEDPQLVFGILNRSRDEWLAWDFLLMVLACVLRKRLLIFSLIIIGSHAGSCMTYVPLGFVVVISDIVSAETSINGVLFHKKPAPPVKRMPIFHSRRLQHPQLCGP